MREPTRVILIAHNDGLFGAERSLLALAAGLQSDPAFRVLVTVPHNGPLAAACREHNIATMVANYRQWLSRERRLPGVAKRTLRNLLALARVEGVVRRFHPDVVYTGTGATAFGALLARRWRVPHVWHLREFGERDYGAVYDWGARRSHRFLAKHADRLVANSEAIRDHFAPRLERNDIKVVYNGFPFGPAPSLDPQAAYQEKVVAPEAPEVLLIGAFVEGKGQHDAIGAQADLAARGKRLRLTLAGSGDPAYTEFLHRLVREHGLTEQVDFAGFVDDPAPLYRRAAITLICSRCEGFGRTAVESLSAGTPVIGTDAGGLPEILCPGHVGLLYPSGDPRALADAMETLLDDPAHYAAIVANGPAQMRRRFDEQHYIRALGQIIRDTAQRPARAPSDAQRQESQQ